jgi:hypothetical protein
MKFSIIPKIILVILMLFGVLFYFSMQDMKSTMAEIAQEHATEYPLDTALKKWPKKLLDSALPSIKAEKRVESAKWTQLAPRYGDVACLRVTMVPDGTKRDGYADYLCQVLLDFNIHGTAVEIRSIHDPNGSPIGSAMCTY